MQDGAASQEDGRHAEIICQWYQLPIKSKLRICARHRHHLCPHGKGLEFDEVIIPQTDERNYRSEIDKSMLYVAVTRAMHRLTLTFHEARPATHWWWIIKEIYPNSLVQDAASNGVSHQSTNPTIAAAIISSPHPHQNVSWFLWQEFPLQLYKGEHL